MSRRHEWSDARPCATCIFDRRWDNRRRREGRKRRWRIATVVAEKSYRQGRRVSGGGTKRKANRLRGGQKEARERQTEWALRSQSLAGGTGCRMEWLGA